jgi:hypothetical protein
VLTSNSMIERRPWGYILVAIAIVASCGESKTGSPVEATPTGGATPGGSSSISGSSGTVAQQGGSTGAPTGGRSATTGGTVGSAGESGAPSTGGRASDGGALSGPSQAGAAGEPGGEGGAGRAATSDEVEQYRACVGYYVAQCARRTACDPSAPESSCLAVSLPRCPDLLFSPGSRLSVNVVDGCAQAWNDADCDEINRGMFPACGYPDGALETGEPCAFSSQCATRACGRFQDDDCGVCLPILKQGDACATSQGACPPGTSCSGTCEPNLPFNLPAGSACEVVGQCEIGYVCRSDEQGGRTCQPLFQVGETCAASWECGEGYCDADTNQCTLGAAVGMPCPQDGWGHLRSCAGTAICDDRPEPAVCVARVGATEPCWVRSGVVDPRGNCDGELHCLCTDADCAERRCRFERKAGEACDDGESACITGTECRAGVCEPIGAQGLFETACEP